MDCCGSAGRVRKKTQPYFEFPPLYLSPQPAFLQFLSLHPVKTPFIALQLWSLRHDIQRDFAATVRKVAALGYDGVELAGYGNLDAAGVKDALASAGLRVAGMHTGAPRLRGEMDAVIGEALLLGARHVICPWWPPERFVSPAACESIAGELAGWGATLRAHGIQFSYHNHDGELREVGGCRVIEWILGAVAPRDLMMEPDVYWLHAGGVAPEKFLRDHGARCRLVHIKDGQDLGGGPVAFAPVLAAIREIGAAEWLVIEQEEFTGDPMAAVGRDIVKLREWLR
jgi:sugar phosphate isomerase/epimerase